MQHKVRVVSGSQRVNTFRFFLYLLLLLLGIWLLAEYFNASPTTPSIPSDSENVVRNETSLTAYRWQDYIPVGHWSFMEEEPEEEQNDCKYEDYIYGKRIQQADPCLITAFKNDLLLPPPPLNEQNHTKLGPAQDRHGDMEKYAWVEKLLIEINRKDEPDLRWPGFFVECGAREGSINSPTMHLEINYNWTGLLVVANAIHFEKLKVKKRNVWAANVAACLTEYPTQLMFYTAAGNSSTEIVELSGPRPEREITFSFSVQCIPLYTMLAALEVITVDYLSLEGEGYELAVLKTIPFELVQFNVMTVRCRMAIEGRNAMDEFLQQKGYRYVKEIRSKLTTDCLYVHDSLFGIASTIKF